MSYLEKKIVETYYCQVECCNSKQAWGIYHPPTFPTCLLCGNMCRCKNEKKKIFKKMPYFFPL